MKLLNKKTTNVKVLGEIVPCNVNEYGVIAVKTDQGATWYYRSLAELNEDWEDYEEPKESEESKKYWFINAGGETLSYYEEDEEPEDTEACKEIGNYFETEEEAEKAVEKLKAIQRLKSHYIRFKLDFVKNKIDFTYRIDGTLHSSVDEERIIFEDLDLLFGGEE